MINGIALTAAALITRLLTVVFNVYLTERVGAAGVGLFSLVMSVYSLAVTFASSGIYLASTRIISGQIVKNSAKGVKRALWYCTLYAFFFGVLASVLLFAFAEKIALFWLSDIRTLSSLRILALSLPPIAVSGALSGYFSAVRRVVKNAVTNVSEQLLRMFFTAFLLVMARSGNIESALCSIVTGITLSEFLALLTSFMLFLLDRKKLDGMEQPPCGGIFSVLIKTALPVAVSSYVRSALMTLEHVLIPKALMRGGLGNRESLASYGVIAGMVLPVIFFPMALLTSFTGLVVPEITRYQARGENLQIKYVTRRVLSFTAVFSFLISALLVYFANSLGILLYDSPEAGGYIRIFALLIPVMYTDNAADAVLKGLGLQVSSMRYNIIDAAVSVILVILLLPRLGIAGYVVVIYVCEALNACLSLQKLLRTVKPGVDPVRCILLPSLAAVGAASTFSLIAYFTNIGFYKDALGIAAGFVCITVLYYAFLRLLGAVTKEDEKWLVFAILGKVAEKSFEIRQTFSQ